MKNQSRKKIKIEMDVTESQAVALNSFFKIWDSFGKSGTSRFVAFYVDGDGNFKPNCDISSEWDLEKHKDLEKLAILQPEGDIQRYDCNQIAHAIRYRKDIHDRLVKGQFVIEISADGSGEESMATKDIISKIYCEFLIKNGIKFEYHASGQSATLIVPDIPDSAKEILLNETGTHSVTRIDFQGRRHTTFTSVFVDGNIGQVGERVRGYVFSPKKYIVNYKWHADGDGDFFIDENDVFDRVLNGELNLISERRKNLGGLLREIRNSDTHI